MGVFTDTVPREMYEDMKSQRNEAQGSLERERDRYAQLVQNFVDMRRHQEGMNPRDFDPEKLDPMNLLGEKTQAAVEEMCGDDGELRIYLRNQAYALTMQRKGQAPADVDEEVAALIRAGDE